jgi:hypothetical protein
MCGKAVFHTTVLKANHFRVTSLLAALSLGVALAACGPTASVDRVGSAVVDDAGSSGGAGGSTGGTGGSTGGAGGSTGGAGGSTGGAGGSTGGTGGSTGGAGGSTGGAGGSTGGAGGVGGSAGGAGGSTGGAGGSTGGTGGSTGGAGGSTGGTGGSTGVDAMVDLPPDMPGMRKAVMVVGDPAALTPGDVRLKAIIEARTFTVTVVDDADAASTSGVHLVVISSTCASSTVGNKYRDVAIPVLDLEASIFDDMKLTGPTKTVDYDEDDATRIVILGGAASHPLAANLSGSVTIVTDQPATCCGVNWGVPNGNAISIASFPGNSGRTTIFAYEKGAKMIDNFNAPARRVGFFAADTSIQYLNADGLRFLNEAIKWAAP